MKKEELSSLRKDELIAEYQKLQRKYNKLEKQLEQTHRENKHLLNLHDDFEKWSVHNIIPIDKKIYSRDEKKQVLAWSESCKIKELETVGNHDEYFILKDGNWYEIKTFKEILQSEDCSNLKMVLESIWAPKSSDELYSKDCYLKLFNELKASEKQKIIKKIIKLSNKDIPDWWIYKDMENLLECKSYEEAFLLFINKSLDFNNIEPLGNYNLYKIYVNKEFY